jgi:hypothetical protein
MALPKGGYLEKIYLKEYLPWKRILIKIKFTIKQLTQNLVRKC